MDVSRLFSHDFHRFFWLAKQILVIQWGEVTKKKKQRGDVMRILGYKIDITGCVHFVLIDRPQMGICKDMYSLSYLGV